MKEVRECPICDWKHEAERPQVPAGALASVFGPGVMSAVAMQQHAWDIERALDAHFRTHSTVDWVKATVALRARVAELERAADNVIRCNTFGCAFPDPNSCPAQCRADQALRAALRLSANKPASLSGE